MARQISKYDDLIDSRDVIERMEELETEGHSNAATPGESYGEIADRDAPDYLDDEDAAELRALRALRDEASGYAPDWQYGETLIRDSYFQTYAQELAEDVCDIDWAKLSWPMTCIDWEQAARELRMDYTSVEFDGITYWIR